MTDLTAFILHAFRTIARAVAEAGVHAGLFKHPELISKTLKRRVSAELKRLGVLLRRLTFLMARPVELAPLVPRPVSNYFEKTEGELKARTAFFSVLPTPATEAPDSQHGPASTQAEPWHSQHLCRSANPFPGGHAGSRRFAMQIPG